jgi:hypothetical protein
MNTRGLAPAILLHALVAGEGDNEVRYIVAVGNRVENGHDAEDEGGPVTVVDIDTDHFFSDSRIALQAAVTRGLASIP